MSYTAQKINVTDAAAVIVTNKDIEGPGTISTSDLHTVQATGDMVIVGIEVADSGAYADVGQVLNTAIDVNEAKVTSFRLTVAAGSAVVTIGGNDARR